MGGAHPQRTNKQTKQKTMYQVHIKNEVNAEVHNFETLSEANTFVVIYAQQNDLTYGIDGDGWQWACDKSNYPTVEAFIFQVI